MIFTRKLAKKGFTLIELLVVIAIMGLLFSVILSTVNSARRGGRNVNRVNSLKAFEKGLEFYYGDKGYYPPACGGNYNSFSYATINSAGACAGGLPGQLRFDNSTSAGFLDELYDLGYISQESWRDPLLPPFGQHDNRYNCRYVIAPCSLPKPPGSSSCLTCKPQIYLLHCKVEGSSEAAENDGGGEPLSYEIMGGGTKLCLTGTP